MLVMVWKLADPLVKIGKNIAYIPQQPYIFPLSLKDNICFYETNTTDEEVERVIEVGLSSLVTTLPNGMHERIGEGGRMLAADKNSVLLWHVHF